MFIPPGGVSMIDAPGQPFHDPVADGALFDALRGGLRPGIECVEMPVNINDPSFGVGDGGSAPRARWPPSGSRGGRALTSVAT